MIGFANFLHVFQLRSGETIEGILLCVRPGPEGGYVLGDVKTLSGKEAHANEFPQPFR